MLGLLEVLFPMVLVAIPKQANPSELFFVILIQAILKEKRGLAYGKSPMALTFHIPSPRANRFVAT